MAGKRKNDEFTTPELSGREKKKRKTAAARTIQVQSAAASGSMPAAAQTANTEAGPSRAVHFHPQLPGSLDVERFAEARAFEIDAMHSAMKTARQSASHRAWQELPRHLRRRAASHDVRRVPLRLRDKAKAEMDPMRKKALGRSQPKRGKHSRVTRTQQLLKRQENKVWLETHIWHAKRMKMENMWGYRLAVQPTEKAFRPSHRASVHGSILHDASYYGFLELDGPQEVIRAALERCCDPQGAGPNAKRFITGARACDTHIYKPDAYPYDLIGPVTVIWQSSSDDMWLPKGRSKPQEVIDLDTLKEANLKFRSTPRRLVWIRIHPSIFEDVYLVIQTSVSYALDAAKKANGPDSKVLLGVTICDLRERLNVFEIMGPKSSQVIKGAFKPIKAQGRKDFDAFWQALGNVQTTASLPRNMVIGCTVHDPRLSFPPKNAHVQTENPSSSATHIFPSSNLALSSIWDEHVRSGLRKPKYKKKDLDERRHELPLPGTTLQPKQQDNVIPMLLIQRSLENSNSLSSGSNSSSADSPSLHGWTLIIPSGWSMPFFSSLTYTGTRVAGQRECQTQAFEAGKPHFPRDYPCTETYQAFSEDRAADDLARWERKPPAKRPNYEALSTRSPFKADWEVVLGQLPSDLVEAQRGQESANPPAKPWLLRGPEVRAVLEAASTMFNHAAGLHEQINKLRAKRCLDPLSPKIRADMLWKSALVMVKVSLSGRGRPGDLAMIYRIEDEEHGEWVAMMKKGLVLSEEEESQIELASLKAPSEDIIGYVTTGNFSLSLGEAYAIGAIPVTRLFELREQASRLGKYPKLLVKVRDQSGTIYRAAHVELLES